VIRTGRRWFWVFAWLVLSSPSFAEDTSTQANQSLDDLFDDLEAGVPSTPAPVVVTPDTGNRPMFLYFGNLETQSLLVSGYTDTSFRSPVVSPYYFLHLKGGIDVMPIPEARLIGTFSSYLPQDVDSTLVSSLTSGSTTTTSTTTSTSTNTGSVLNLDELYLDYAVLKSAMFRIGTYAVTWGSGHLFNPGNLVSDTSGAVNVRGYLPLGDVNLTGLVIATKSFFAVASKPRGDELGYAGNVEFKWGWLSGGLSGYHQLAEGTYGDLALRTGLGGFDLYTEAIAHQDGSLEWVPGFLGGIDKEFDLGVKVQTVAEYWLNGVRGEETQHHLGVGLTTGSLDQGMKLKLSAKWLHSLTDSSGQLAVGLTAEPLPKLKFALGVPWTYGTDSSYYVSANSDPEKRRLSVSLSVNISLDFEKAR
jgi:hypothetical protein